MSTNASAQTSEPQIILYAEPGFLVGKYKVWARQVRPHPGQRQLCEEWVESLHQRFREVGIDRAAHPIKVLLEENQRLDTLTEMSKKAGFEAVPDLPEGVIVLVYHGQHRIAACQKMEDVEEHWWLAEVYRKGILMSPLN